MEEIWKSVKEYEGYYSVSNLGRIRSDAKTVFYCRNGQFIEQHRNQCTLKPRLYKGAAKVRLHKNGQFRQYMLHNLIFEAFHDISIPRNKLVIHLDGDKLNNRLTNLQLSDYSSIQLGKHPCVETNRTVSSYRIHPVKCLNTSGYYNSVREASQDLDLPYEYLLRCIKADRPCRGYMFESMRID